MPMKQFKQVALTASIFPTDADGHELSLASVNDLTSISSFELSANKAQVLSSVTDPLELSVKYPSVKAVKDALASIPIQDGVELSANKFQALSDVAPADLATKYPSAAALSASVEETKGYVDQEIAKIPLPSPDTELSTNKCQVLDDIPSADLSVKYPSAAAVKDELTKYQPSGEYEAAANKTTQFSVPEDQLSVKYPTVGAVSSVISDLAPKSALAAYELTSNKASVISSLTPEELSSKYPTAEAVSNFVTAADNRIQQQVNTKLSANSIKTFATKKEFDDILKAEQIAGLSSFKNNDLVKISGAVTYIIDAIVPHLNPETGSISSTSYSLTHLTNEKLMSPNEDIVISCDPTYGRGFIDVEPAKHWYKMDTGVVFSEKTVGQNTKDGVTIMIYSQSEHCYYIGSTEGLYRTYNDDLTQWERILSAQITIDSTDIPKCSHVKSLHEIGDRKYFLTVTGFTKNQVVGFIYDAKANTVSSISLGNGWSYQGYVLQNDASKYVEVCGDAGQDRYLRRITISKADWTMSYESINATGYQSDNSKHTQYVDVISSDATEMMFITHHWSDNGGTGANSGRGVDYVPLNSVSTLTDLTVQYFTELSSARVFQFTKNRNELYACCGLSTDYHEGASPDHLGLHRFKLNGATVIHESLSGDQYLSSFTNCKEIFYCADAKRWLFVLNQVVYVSNEGQDGYWTELTSTGVKIEESNYYPKFNQCHNIIEINGLLESSEANSQKRGLTLTTSSVDSTNLFVNITSILGAQHLATLKDIAIKALKVDGKFIEHDEHGFIDISLSSKADKADLDYALHAQAASSQVVLSSGTTFNVQLGGDGGTLIPSMAPIAVGHCRDTLMALTLPDELTTTLQTIDWSAISDRMVWCEGKSPLGDFDVTKDLGKTFLYSFTDIANDKLLVSKNELFGTPVLTDSSVAVTIGSNCTIHGKFLSDCSKVEYTADSGQSWTQIASGTVTTANQVVLSSSVTSSFATTYNGIRLTIGSSTLSASMTVTE